MSTILHTIKVYLYESQLAGEVERYYGRVAHERTLSLREVCINARERGGSKNSPEMLEYMFKEVWDEIAFCLCDGFAVNIGFGLLRLTIHGEFNSVDEQFDPEKHRLEFNFTPLAPLYKYAPDAVVNVLGKKKERAYISTVTDLNTKSTTEISSGGLVQVEGKDIKVVPEDDEETGVFFIASDGTVYPARNKPLWNYPQKLLLSAPDVPAGVYTIQVVTKYSGGGILLTTPITVECQGIVVVA
jgi:hypothetical protein